MKSFRNPRRWVMLASIALVVLTAGLVSPALGELPTWIRNTEAGTKIEAALFRWMVMPGAKVLFRKPPRETREALGELIKTQPQDAGLYDLRAREDEQQLDFAAAESDWKHSLEYSSNPAAKSQAELALADFYHRRLRPQEEIQALSTIANAPLDASEKLTPTSEQRCWKAFERIFVIIHAQGFPQETSVTQYRAWIQRYPQEQTLFVRFLDFLISQKDYAAANQLVADYHAQFPGDEVFPVKAKALLEYRQGSLEQGLALYEHTFQPLWNPELVKSYFDLLAQTRGLHEYLDQARAKLNANPEDLDGTARVFYYYQQQGNLDAAQQTITSFRLHKEASKSAWSGQELYVCARLLEEIRAYPESAHYYYGLYNSQGMSDAQERALAGLTNLLLTAPEAPIRLGSGEISMYRDIATLDPGPGFFNGILSLILNTTEPGRQFSEEEQRAVPYFHRSTAAELLALLDRRFPKASRRAELHAQLIEFYANSGESDAVIRGGTEFLVNFPNASERTSVALHMADAYARNGKADSEFAIYDSVLQELAAKAEKVPLGDRANLDQNNLDQANLNGGSGIINEARSPSHLQEAQPADGGEGDEGDATGTPPTPSKPAGRAFQVQVESASVATQAGARSPEYAHILERYLTRLVELKQTRKALEVLRGEIDRNPDDPGLYERLAIFLEQNSLTAEQEEVYRRAIAHFPSDSWYHKLARFYLRRQKTAEFERLTQDVTKTFSGTALESYFEDVRGGGTPTLYLRLNLFANQRFPHNPVFVRNLLSAYHTKQTYDQAAWEALLRQHWFEEDGLRNEFFEFLSRTNQLESELAALRQQTPAAEKHQWHELAQQNPAAARFLAEADLWWCNYEGSAPVLRALAEEYPADFETARAASSVYRSLAYFDPAQTAVAVHIEENLHLADPASTEVLARIGDIYADRELYSQAAPYWEEIPKTAPGQPDGYLEAATIYWDYFDFDSALRLMADGRKRLGDDNLYRYEAGAVSENQRDYPHAIKEYLAGALAAGPDSAAGQRLLQLANRPSHRDLVEQRTANLAAAPNSPTDAITLRVRILEAQSRKKDVESFLDSVVERSTSIEQVEAMAAMAEQESLETVHQHALEKQAVLTTDPVSRLQIRYALVHFYEGRKDLTSAQRNVDALYRDNPKILAVVRQTVDFYWRWKKKTEAINVLLAAAKAAYPELGKQFSFEAARKATEAHQYQQAREIIATLLKDSPFDAQYLAAAADTYSQSGDNTGLKLFYLEKLDLFRNASMSADERKTRVAILRRGLIPALTHLKDYSGAVDQYVELINKFPEDAELTTEAALYAQRFQCQSQLLEFYAKTVAQSPNDYRWAMVLARVQTGLEDFPAAIATYGKSIAVRPDRTDLRIARAELNERLMHFDDAVADYDRLYELAYKDPKWMESIALARARQRRNDDAVRALRMALIDGRPQNASKYFEVARRLEGWGMLTEARGFAEQGIDAAGSDLLAVSEQQPGATLYTRIMTRLRQQEKAYAVLQAANNAASSVLPVVEKEVAKHGIGAITETELRQQEQRQRIATARQGLTIALREMGSTADKYFTPEEKASLVKFVETSRAGMTLADIEDFTIPLAQSAGLGELEARLRFGVMMDSAYNPQLNFSQMNEFVFLQRRRLQFAELGLQMESFAKRLDHNHVDPARLAAIDAYASAGDSANELRLLRTSAYGFGSLHRERLFELLLANDPQDLARRASASDQFGDAAAAFAFAHADATLVHAIVTGRASKRAPVWASAYNALTGLYFRESAPAVNSAFLSALGDSTIGERLGKSLDRNLTLAGTVWFYYGSRYGAYLGSMKTGTPEDFLPAMLEQSPATASNYLALADYYDDRDDTADTITELFHTLELSPESASIRDRLAVVYEKGGQHTEALAEWKRVYAILGKQVDTTRVPESFWSDFAHTCEHLSSHHLFNSLQTQTEALVRTYLRRNGNYRSNAVLRSVYLAGDNPRTSTAWILDLASAAHDPAVVLSDVVEAKWMPLDQRAPLYARILEAKRDAVAKADGLEKGYAEQTVRAWEIRWIQHLVHSKQWPQAGEALAVLPFETREAEAATVVPIELSVAAQQGTLDARIASYGTDGLTAPSADVLRSASKQLYDAGDPQSARKILEFVFAREIESHNLVAVNFLGLAEIRLAAGDSHGALELLRRLVVAVGAPFENLEPAAALLEKTGHNAEALEFLQQMVASAPWEAAYPLRLARASLAASHQVDVAHTTLTTIASNQQVPYSLRTQAALVLTGATEKLNLGSQELNVLAGPPNELTPMSADHPFFHESRIRAARLELTQRDRLRLLHNSLSNNPAHDDVRIPLFEAATAARADQFALGVLEPLLQRQFLRTAPHSGRTTGDTEFLRSEDEEEAVSSADTSPPSKVVLGLSTVQQAQIAKQLGDTLLRLNRSKDAIPYLDVARHLEKRTGPHAEIVRELAAVRAEILRAQKNEARSPILHPALEQDRIVRPRLLAQAAPRTRVAAAKGGLTR